MRPTCRMLPTPTMASRGTWRDNRPMTIEKTEFVMPSVIMFVPTYSMPIAHEMYDCSDTQRVKKLQLKRHLAVRSSIEPIPYGACITMKMCRNAAIEGG